MRTIKLIMLMIGLTSLSVSHSISTESHQVKTVSWATGLDQPWGMEFLPSGQLLVTEKKGNLRIIEPSGQVSPPLKGMLPITENGQGGLLDVTADPNFNNNHLIYFSYAKNEPGGLSRTAVGKAELRNQQLHHVQQIWQQQQAEKGGYHYGSRLVFDQQGYLFVTTGDRNYRKAEAQDLTTHFGKIVRIDTSGNPAPNNPFINQQSALDDIYSYGHRNVQGAYLHPQTGLLWINEHGPKGGDEINIIKPGHNYGWPVITYGVNYNGTPITNLTEKAGMEQPIHYWDPSIATSGMLIYTGEAFPNWQGDVFTGALKLRHLNRIKLDNNHKVLSEERLLTELKERIRAIAQGPDGFIYVATDSTQGQIIKITPK